MATRPTQRVLVLSAIGDVTSKVRCLELGAADYLPKPFAVAELIARVRARLRQLGAERTEQERTAGSAPVAWPSTPPADRPVPGQVGRCCRSGSSCSCAPDAPGR